MSPTRQAGEARPGRAPRKDFEFKEERDCKDLASIRRNPRRLEHAIRPPGALKASEASFAKTAARTVDFGGERR